MAKVIICKNPFRPQVERELVSVRAGTRVDTMLRQQALVKGRAGRLQRLSTFVVQVNGQYLLADQWARRIRSDDVVIVSLVPEGGGGSNPLRFVLQIALIALAAWAGFAIGGVWGALAAAGISMVGSMLLNLVFPPPRPNAMQAREQASPTHTLSAQGNSARLQEAIPVMYGRHLIYPDFASQPYTEADSNNVYLYQLFCLGQGDLEIEKIRIEETSIENFAEVTWEVVRPGGLVTLFPDNVVTSNIVQNLELKALNEEGGGGYMGPYVTNPAGTKCNVIGIDIALPMGLYYAEDDGSLGRVRVSWRVEARPINDVGAPLGEWTLLGEEFWWENTATPQVMSFRYGVPDGRFEVRAMRVGNTDLDQRCANTVSWAGMRAYLPSQQSYGNVTMLAVAMRATNNLNQSTSRRINVIATRKLQTWDPVAGWSQELRATRSPAWAAADMLRNRTYGRGMPDTAYNLPELYRLAQVWEQRGDYYDDVIDTTMTLWDALSRAVRVGRAMPMYYAGLIDFVRNEPRSIPRAMFTPDNIIEGSFSIDYSFIEHDSPDHVIVEYIDGETWQPAEVECVLPGGTQDRPARVPLPGVTNRSQAWREGISMAASNRDQRTMTTLRTEMEGHIPNYLDLVTVVHDVPKWGLSGFVTGWNPTTRRLQVSEPLEWYGDETHYISLRQRDGVPRGPFRVTPGADALECVIASAPADLYISDGIIEEPTLYTFGPGERTGLRALVRRAVPDEDGNVTLELVNYADSVHTAELGGEVPPPPPPSLLPSTPDAPIVAEVTVYATATPGEQIASCTPARGAQVYEFEASQDQGQTWARLGADTVPSLTIRLPVGPWWVRARGVGKNPGPWKTWQGHISATMLPPPVLTHFVASPVLWGIRLAWTWPSAIRLRYIEIWHSRTPNFSDATPLGQFAFPQGSHEMLNLAITTELYFWARVRDEADQPGPWYCSLIHISEPTRPRTPSQGAGGYNELITEEIVTGGLGELIMGDIRDIPNIRDAVDEISVDLGELNGRVDEINGQVQELLSAGEWDPAAAYAVGTVVFADGKMYRAKQAVPAGTPVSDAAHWELIGDYASIADGLAALAVQAQETISRVDQAEGRIQANAEQISTVAGKIDDPSTGLGALGSAVQSMRTQVGQLESGLQSLSEATTVLSSQVDGLEQAQQGLATAVNSLSTRVTLAEGRLDAQSSSITQLGASVSNADAKAVAAQQAAAAAADAAGAKGEVIFSSTAPPAAKRLAQNLWIDTTGNANAPKRWNGSAWVVVTDRAASDAAAAAAAAKAAADAAQATANQKADTSTVQALTNRVTATEQGLTAQGESVTKIDARLSAGLDSDSLLPDYMMANPDSWYSYYPGTDLAPNFIRVTDGKIAPTVFHFDAGRTFNFSVVTLPITQQYRIQAWMRRSPDSDGQMRITYKYRKTTDGDSGLQTNYSSASVIGQVPADGQWHLVDFVYQAAASVIADGFTGIRFGFAINYTSTKGWAQIQGYRVTRVAQGADINPDEVATAQSVTSLSGTVTQQGNTITSQGRDLTALQNEVRDPNTGLAATAGALNDTNSRVTSIEGKQEAQATNQLVLNAEVKRLQSDEDAELERVLNQWQTRASLAEFKNVQAEENRALAESITTLAVNLEQGSAAVEQIMRSMVEMEGEFAKVSAAWGVKLQANANGVRYVAGVGLDLTNESGVMQSTFAVLADRFAVMHAVNGNPTTVFSVQGGTSILNTALIGDASITSAKIQSLDANKIESANLAAKLATLGTAYVSAAHIHWAQIQKVHIVDAAVDTLKLAGNAVTIHASVTAPYFSPGYVQSERAVNLTFYLPYAADITLIANVEPFTILNGSGARDAFSDIWYDNGGYIIARVASVRDLNSVLSTGGSATFKGWLAAGPHSITMRQKPSLGGNTVFPAASMVALIAMR
ncbi:host specificity factor TipJ family phage tail protein [Alcaligenes sp. Marseille-Q7550]